MKNVLIAASAVGVMVGGWKLAHRQHVDDGDIQIADRVWLDHMPKHDRDLVRAFVVLTRDHDDRNVGFLQAGSRWHHQFDGFRFDRTGNDLAVEFPQNSWKATWHTKVSRCSVGKFTLCLEITAPRGTFQYFSRDEWVIKSADAALALEAKVLHDAPAATGEEPAALDVDEPLAH